MEICNTRDYAFYDNTIEWCLPFLMAEQTWNIESDYIENSFQKRVCTVLFRDTERKTTSGINPKVW